jgi:nicotinate-nucleotide adenylyltransferase
MTALALKDRSGLSKLERRKPALLHGRAAAVLLQERYGITDGAVLEAVRLHTVGGEAMGALAKLIYIADKVEWSRENIAPLLRDSVVQAGSGLSLDELFTLVLRDSVAYLDAQKTEISKGTRRLLETMRKKGTI